MLFSRRPVCLLAVISSLVGFFFIPILQNRGMNLILTGFIVAIYNILSGIIQFPLGKVADKYSKRTVIVISGILTSAALFIIPLTDNVILIISAMILTSIGSVSLLSVTSALSVKLVREKGMASTMGFLSTSNSIGMVLGCLFLGLLPDKQ